MILDYENGIRVEIIRAICHYGEANNKYMHYYDKTKESAWNQYLDLTSNIMGFITINSLW